jgi:hypothetical protein
VMVSKSRGLLVGLAVCIALPLLPVSMLELAADGGTHREIISPFGATSVTLSYVHSVEKTRVEEKYDARPSGIVMQSMAWQSFGAGLPDDYDECVDGWYVKHTDTRLGKALSYWFLPVNDVWLDVGAKRVFEGPERESTMTLSVGRVPLGVCILTLVRSSHLPL